MKNRLKIFYNYYLKKNYIAAFNDALKAAKEGDADAQIFVSTLFMRGEGVETNIEEGLKWRKKAADQNDEEALYLYGWHCLEDKKFEEGKIYLEKAASFNCMKATYDLAGLYYYGDYGFKKDINLAISFYSKACILGKKEACKELYILLKELHGKEKAINYIKKDIGLFKYLKLSFVGNILPNFSIPTCKRHI